MECPRCKHANPEGVSYCGACGWRLGDQFAITKLLPRIFVSRRKRSGKPAPVQEERTVSTTSRVLYLQRSDGFVLRLSPVKVLTIGRHPDNDLVLSSDGVSRRHARIEYQEPHFVIIDLGSANGTRVDGAFVTEAPLVPGAEIQIHDQRLQVSSRGGNPDETGRGSSEEEGETLMLDSDAIRRGQASALQGNLSQIPLGEVCRLLRGSHRTGTLYLREGGRIHVQEGQITHAEVGELAGKPAFYELMRHGRGDFEFRAGLPGTLQHSISLSTSALLEKAAQLLEDSVD